MELVLEFWTFAARQGKGRILLNMDESSIPYFVTDKAGTVVTVAHENLPAHPPPAENITRAQQ